LDNRPRSKAVFWTAPPPVPHLSGAWCPLTAYRKTDAVSPRNSIAARTLATKEERLMGLATYRVFGIPGEWRVDHDGKTENTYVTKEAAFEAAVGLASFAARPSSRGHGSWH